MDDIASKLGISKKTLYKYVSDKSDLVKKVFSAEEKPHKIRGYTEEGINAVEQFYLVYKHVMDVIKNYNPHLIFDLKKYYPQVYEELRERRKDAILTQVKKNIVKGQKEGLYRADLNPDIIAKFHYIKVEALIENNFVNAGEYPISEIFKELFKYHIYALANEKGRKIIEDFKIFEDDEN